MATVVTPAEPVKKVIKKKPVAQGVTKAEFNSLIETVSSLADIVKGMASAKPQVTAEQAVAEKKVDKAGPRMAPVPEEWQEKAEELIGDALDHVEVVHLRGGGTVFTAVIKKEKSNAGKEYLALYGSDRRSKEIGTEGIEGVEQWCKLIRDNLRRPR